jgi:hypothetical protein
MAGARAARHRPRRSGRLRVRRAYRNGRLKCPKTDGSVLAVPLQAIALEALDALPRRSGSAPVFPAPRGGYLDLHNFRYSDWEPAQREVGIDPIRRIYDLRHSFATFALRAGISTFDLSRYMGASLTMIDRHYGHLAKDGRQHAIALLDDLSGRRRPRGGRDMDAQEGVTRGAQRENKRLSRTIAREVFTFVPVQSWGSDERWEWVAAGVGGEQFGQVVEQ